VPAPRSWLIGREAPVMLVSLLLGIHLLAFGYQLATATVGLAGDVDIQRFQEIADAQGLPYRDVPVEYAPVELLAIEAVASPDSTATARRVTILALAADLATAAAVVWGWGRRSGAAYLLVGLPLLPIMVARLDPLVVALAAIGLAAIRRDRPRAGGIVLALACLAKVWPLLLVPILLIERRRRAGVWFAAAFGAWVAAWLTVGGLEGVRQVLTFRGATGWQVESLIGATVQAVTGETSRLDQGALRVGEVPGWARVVLVLALAAAVVAVWRRAAAWRGVLEGDPTLAALGALLALSPLFSVQYACWVAPWVAIAGAHDEEDRTFVRAGFAVILLTFALLPIYRRPGIEPWTVPVTETILIVRGLVCALLPLWWLAGRRKNQAV
jgi:hypothetical protein